MKDVVHKADAASDTAGQAGGLTPAGMVERVAEAVWLADPNGKCRSPEGWREYLGWYHRGAGDPNSSVHYSTIAVALTLARAAIAAMREPTEAMLFEGWSAPFPMAPDAIATVWKAMIDEALK